MNSGKLPIKTRLFDPQVFVFHKKNNTQPPTNKQNTKL